MGFGRKSTITQTVDSFKLVNILNTEVQNAPHHEKLYRILMKPISKFLYLLIIHSRVMVHPPIRGLLSCY